MSAVGAMNERDSWSDYFANTDPRFVPHHDALRRALIKRARRRGGDWHQRAPAGVPVFDDGAVGTFSFRVGRNEWQIV